MNESIWLHVLTNECNLKKSDASLAVLQLSLKSYFPLPRATPWPRGQHLGAVPGQAAKVQRRHRLSIHGQTAFCKKSGWWVLSKLLVFFCFLRHQHHVCNRRTYRRHHLLCIGPTICCSESHLKWIGWIWWKDLWCCQRWPSIGILLGSSESSTLRSLANMAEWSIARLHARFDWIQIARFLPKLNELFMWMAGLFLNVSRLKVLMMICWSSKAWCWGFIFYADSQAFDPGIMAWKATRWTATLSRLVYHCPWHLSSRLWGMARDHRSLQCFGWWRHPWQTCYFWLPGAYQRNGQVFRAHVWSDVFLLEDEGGHECCRMSRLQEAGNGFAAAACFILSKSAS